MNSHDLVVFKGQVVTGFLEMCCLKKETTEKGFAYRGVVLLVGHLSRCQLESLLDGDTQKLLSYIVGCLHSSEVNVVIIAPVSVLFL